MMQRPTSRYSQFAAPELDIKFLALLSLLPECYIMDGIAVRYAALEAPCVRVSFI